MNSRWLFATLILAAAMLALHVWGISEHIYWQYRWFDTPMHILGGAMAGAFLVAVLGKVKKADRVYLYAGGMFTVAVGWEIFEYYFGISTGQKSYVFDTVHDIGNDILGGTLIYILANETTWH
jgi:hypothetical protein